ncbi:hypothetical protein HKD37_U058155 [Glycine soja]
MLIFCDNVNKLMLFSLQEMATPPNSPPPPPSTNATTQLPPVGAERPVVHVDAITGKANDPHKKKFRTYLGIVARDKVDVTYENWKQVSAAHKDLIWEDIQLNLISLKHMMLGQKRKYFRLWGSGRDSLRCAEKGASHPEAKHCPPPPHVLSRGGYEYLEKKLMDEKTKKKLEEAAQSRSTDTMARTKKIGQMTSEVVNEIVDKIDSLEEQASVAIGRPEHPGHVRAAGAGVTIKQYFGPARRTSHTSSSMAPEDPEQLTQQIRDQLEESITKKSQMQSQELALPLEPEVGPSTARVNTKESCVDPSGNNPDTGDSDKCELYIEENPPRMVALERVYEGSTIVQNIPMLHDQVKVGVEEVRDADAHIPMPIEEVKLVGQALNTFLAWPTHLVKRLSEKGVVGPTKLADMPDHEVDDPLYLMTLTIPQLFLKPLQVMWDATVFGVFNEDFPLYIKHEDLSEIAHGAQCLSISSIQRSGQSQFQSESYMKNWMQNSKWDVYLGAYLNGALKGLDDTPQPKSKASARWIVVKCNTQKGSTECGYYVMHWMSTIILGSFKNNWEMTTGTREIEGTSHPVGKVLFES